MRNQPSAPTNKHINNNAKHPNILKTKDTDLDETAKSEEGVNINNATTVTWTTDEKEDLKKEEVKDEKIVKDEKETEKSEGKREEEKAEEKDTEEEKPSAEEEPLKKDEEDK